MTTELTLVFYAASMLLLVAFSGTLTALEILSLGRVERNEENGLPVTPAGRLVAEPVRSGAALGLARAVAVVLTAVTSLHVGRALMGEGAGSLALGAFVVVSLLGPVFVARLMAVRDADRFLYLSRFLALPTVYLLSPAVGAIARATGRVAPDLLERLAFQLSPLKERIEMFGRADGDGEDEEHRIMSSVMEFGETRVREVMVPRIDIVAVEANMDPADALARIMEAGHSRIPVYEDTIDRIAGTVYTKDLLRKIVSGEQYSLRELAREAFFVPESKPIDDLLTEFKVRKQHLAIVVDEYGGTAGIVTLEDVLEELVGDIQDEFDTEEELIRRIDDDTAQCNAKVRIDELNEELGLELNEEAADTLGGLLYHLIGKVPEVGDTCTIDPLVFEVRTVERQRIDRVRVRGLSKLSEPSEDGVA